jgi:GT2 family glycosyltransferase
MNKVSVLMPTRNRFDLAINSIESLFKNCKDVDNFEVLLAVDNDDLETTNRLSTYFHDRPNVKMFFFERQYYRGLHNYINRLVNEASGTSLMLWNDDSTIDSKNWDYEIIKNHDKFCVLSPKVQNMEHYWKHQGVLFPIIPKKWVELTKIWSPTPGLDSWIDVLSKRLNILVNIESIVISHNRYELTGDNKDQTYIEGRADLQNPSLQQGFEVWNHSELLQQHQDLLSNYINQK